jgi:UBX domain-containing protein 7
MDDAISTVVAITGSTPQVARHFLSLTDGHAEQAIQLFFDSPDLSSSMAQEAPATTATQPARSKERISGGGSRDPINLDSDEDTAMDTDPDFDNDFSEHQHPRAAPNAGSENLRDYEDDEAVARRIQEELYAGGDMTSYLDSQDVRAPLARTTETLVGPGAEWTAEDMHEAVLEQLRARQQPRTSMSWANCIRGDRSSRSADE